MSLHRRGVLGGFSSAVTLGGSVASPACTRRNPTSPLCASVGDSWGQCLVGDRLALIWRRTENRQRGKHEHIFWSQLLPPLPPPRPAPSCVLKPCENEQASDQSLNYADSVRTASGPVRPASASVRAPHFPGLLMENFPPCRNKSTPELTAPPGGDVHEAEPPAGPFGCSPFHS